MAFAPRPVSLNTDGTNERSFGEVVSGNYFTVLGIRMAAGRGFLPDEDKTPGAHPVAVISHKLWRARFGGDSSAVGRTIKINGHPFTVVGVAEEKYPGLIRGLSVDLWIPAMMIAQATPGSDSLVERGDRGFLVIGRLRPGATLDQARADFRTIGEQLYQGMATELGNHSQRVASDYASL